MTTSAPGGERTAVRRRGSLSGPYLPKLAFVLPALLLFGAFVILPLGASVYYAFTQWDGLTSPTWTGVRNFVRAFADTTYLRSYVNVSLYILGTIFVEVGFGLIMAVVLNSDRPGFSLLRVLFFSPVVLSMVAAGLLWTFVYDLRFGLLNAFLANVGLSDLMNAWLANPRTALAAVTVVSGWKYAGFYMIIYLAALRRIPSTVYEAATLDGAGPFQRFTRITLPLLRETTVVTLLLCITGGFGAFDLFFTMTNGQPFGATEIPTTWIVKQAFDLNNMGYGIALTVIMAAVIGLISIVYLRRTARRDVVQY